MEASKDTAITKAKVEKEGEGGQKGEGKGDNEEKVMRERIDAAKKPTEQSLQSSAMTVPFSMSLCKIQYP